MSVPTVIHLLALLAVAAMAITATVLAARVLCAARFAATIGRHPQVGPALAAAVAVTATAGSLFLSEVAHFDPCRLCWWQRGAMYPLAALLVANAAGWRPRGVRRCALALAVAGASVSSWHVLIERYPTLESSSCDPFNPCSIRWVEELGGWMTIPTMALVGFVTIFALLALWAPSRTVPTLERAKTV